MKQNSTKNTNDNIKEKSNEMGSEYLDTREAAIEADQAARRRCTTFKGNRNFLSREPTQYVFDRRNKYGTGSIIFYSPTKKGEGKVVYFTEGEAMTTCPIQNHKLHGDEVTCDKSHRFVRRWENGKIVPNVKQAMAAKALKIGQTR